MYSTLNHKHSCCVKAEDEVSSAHKSYDQIASKKGEAFLVLLNSFGVGSFLIKCKSVMD